MWGSLSIESPVVTMKMVVNTRNKIETNIGIGSCCVTASSAPGKLKPSNAELTLPGFAISNARPEPPTIVNQKQVVNGATTLMVVMIWRMLRPREIRAIKMAIIGP
ncbi:hypothetical protein M892_23980 [Vibrio campbellii ATCC BAA-1116]|uniref:Uncharacterized protein n=1 Tax=Vibrio campbellii (strain ATCC BAA-1116) TaxID=2902295 RepID=A7N2L6_VIBC1|nr:hypothetical protein VIBHAR_05504 [Vibrio campbellii ATCC BAA-1116]AGU98709.1 hypothetical protein M892_23980 [Vibrio campbellii ATCC BAA-1116]